MSCKAWTWEQNEDWKPVYGSDERLMGPSKYCLARLGPGKRATTGRQFVAQMKDLQVPGSNVLQGLDLERGRGLEGSLWLT